MAQTRHDLKFGMVNQAPEDLKIWWKVLSKHDKDQVETHIGFLPSLMEMNAWPELIETITLSGMTRE
ncbi:hypothetical protein HAX54_052823, partial [Datura stramonium]|nr:hypothetical protein [Datura stramonium]